MNEPASDSTSETVRRDGTAQRRVRALFDAVIELAPDERAAWIAANVETADDRARLLRLMAAQDVPGFLDIPIGEHAGRLMADLTLAEGLVGQRIGAFRIGRLLGQGGMAAVFLGTREDGDFHQEVAIKLLRRGLYSEIEQRLFQRERRVLASLNHAHIARLIDGGLTDAGVPYLVMEYVDGSPITRYANEHALDVRARLGLFLTVCRAVETAHRALIVHRDIKPSNILVASDGNVKLLDFGIAKLLEDNVESSTVGVFTPDYAAPEQLASKPVTTATDVYALGVLLHELLLGIRPGTTNRRPSALVNDGARRGPDNGVASALLRRHLRGDLDNVLLKALAAEPEQRYASAGAFADDIERHLAGHPVAAHPPSWRYRARKFFARHRGAVLATAAFVLAMLTSLGIALWQAGVARRQAQRADAVQTFLVGVFETNSSYQADPAQARATTAQHLLEIGASKIDGAMNDAPDAKLRMLNLLGQLHSDLGLDEAAARLYRKAIDVARVTYGGDSLDAFDAEISLADALHSSNSDEAAKSVLDEAQATLDHNGGREPLRHARLFDQFAEFDATRDPQRALDYARRSVALYEGLPLTSDFGFALSRKARAERQTGLDADAIASYRRAIDVSRSIDGDTSPDLPRYYAELAEIQYAHHDIVGGEQSARKALDAAKSIHGENHVDVVQCEMRLGRLLADTGRVEEGLSLLESAKRKVLVLRGPDDGFHTPQVLYQRGILLIRSGRIEEALADTDAAVSNRRRDRPGTIPLAQFLEGAATARIELGEFVQAEENLDEGTAIRTQAGQKPPSVLFDSNIVPRIQLALAQGRADRASQLLPQLATAGGKMDSLDRQAISDRLLTAEVDAAAGDWASAIELAQSVRQSIETSELAKYYVSLASRADVVEGEATLGRGDAEGAIALLQRALAERVRHLDPGSPEIARVEIALAECYLQLGDMTKASALARDAAAVESKHAKLGPQYSEPLRRIWASRHIPAGGD